MYRDRVSYNNTWAVRYDQLSRSPGLTPVMVACIKCHNGNEWEGTGDGTMGGGMLP